MRAQAAPEARCFQETGQCIEGRLREYWEEQGGLAVFGFPVTPATTEQVEGQDRVVQWFERNRLELHADQARPYDVLLGRLGDDRLRQLGVDWYQLPPEEGPHEGCLWFAETKRNVCDQAPGLGFKSRWQRGGLTDPSLDARGRSLALYGLPLTSAREETNAAGETVLTQWFERARLEWHPDKPDEFKVLLGLLGVEVRAGQAPGAPAPTPSPYDGVWRGFTGQSQPFEMTVVDGIVNLLIFRFKPNGRCTVIGTVDPTSLGDARPVIVDGGFRYAFKDHRASFDLVVRFTSTRALEGVLNFESYFRRCLGGGKTTVKASWEPLPPVIQDVDGEWAGTSAAGDRLTMTIKNRSVASLNFLLGRSPGCELVLQGVGSIERNLVSVNVKDDLWHFELTGTILTPDRMEGMLSADMTRGQCRNEVREATRWEMRRVSKPSTAGASGGMGPLFSLVEETP